MRTDSHFHLSSLMGGDLASQFERCSEIRHQPCSRNHLDGSSLLHQRIQGGGRSPTVAPAPNCHRVVRCIHQNQTTQINGFGQDGGPEELRAELAEYGVQVEGADGEGARESKNPNALSTDRGGGFNPGRMLSYKA